MTDLNISIAASADDGYAYADGSNFDNTSTGINIGNFTQSRHAFFRFLNVTIPKGATIDTAIMRFVAASSLSSDVDVDIHFEQADSASQPTDGSDLIGRSLGSAIDWDSQPNYSAGSSYDTPELKTILQTIVDRAGWSSGNNVVVHIVDDNTGTFTRRQLASYDHTSYSQAELRVTYTPAPNHESITVSESISFEMDLTRQENVEISEHIQTELEFIGEVTGIYQDVTIQESIEISNLDLKGISAYEQIEIAENVTPELTQLPDATFTVQTGTDDGYGDQSTGAFFTRTTSSVSIGDNGSGNQWRAYFRFLNVDIVDGAVIESAILRLQSSNTRSGTCKQKIHFEAADNPSAPSSGADLIGRSLTTGTAWTVPNMSQNTSYDSPDIATELQEVIDRGGWNSGQALICYLDDDSSDSGGDRAIAAYENAWQEAQLLVRYNTPGRMSANDSVVIEETVLIKLDLIEHENITISEFITIAKEIIDIPAQTDQIEMAEFIQLERGFTGEIPLFSETVNILEFVSIGLGPQISVFESIDISESADIRPNPQTQQQITLSENVNVERGYQVAVDDSFVFNDSFSIFNYTRWLREYDGIAKRRFYFTLSPYSDDLDDIEIQSVQIYATKRSGNPSYLQVTIFGFAYAAEIALRSNAQIKIEIGYEVDGEIVLREQILSADLEDISTYEGGDSRSIVLSGHETTVFGNQLITFDLKQVSYRAYQNRNRRFRLPFIDPFLNPGDTVVIGDESFTCNDVVYIIGAETATMEMGESD